MIRSPRNSLALRLQPDLAGLNIACSRSDLMASLIKRNAIPNHRVQYFTNPDYHFGSTKGAYKDVFERNGTKGREIFEHPHFLKFLRYFLFGASLPEDAIREFAERVR